MQPAVRVQLSAQQLLLNLAGTIPAELEGTLLRNGPGLLEIGGKALSQPLDGDGMVRSCLVLQLYPYICIKCIDQGRHEITAHRIWG